MSRIMCSNSLYRQLGPVRYLPIQKWIQNRSLMDCTKHPPSQSALLVRHRSPTMTSETFTFPVASRRFSLVLSAGIKGEIVWQRKEVVSVRMNKLFYYRKELMEVVVD